jgi:glycosyltransferase involved in cell wall biosynthesis
MSGAPRVSVITCVYNGERFLRRAIESILGQSFGDFEYWLVDDCSTDHSRDIIRSYLHDPRVHLLSTPGNVGTYAAANLALERARAGYVARMDADDLSLPRRLEMQVAFLDTHRNVGLLGSAYQAIDEEGALVDRSDPIVIGCRDLRWTLLFRNCIVHSTVMYRREIAARVGYYPTGRYGRDYDLWLKMSQITEIAQLPVVTVQYRINRRGITATQRQARDTVWRELRLRELAALLGRPADDPLVVGFARRAGSDEYTPETLTFSDLDWEQRFVSSLVEPFIARYGYSGPDRASIRTLARDYSFWLVRWREAEAPLWAMSIYLRLGVRHRQPKALRRVLAGLARWMIGGKVGWLRKLRTRLSQWSKPRPEDCGVTADRPAGSGRI